jgi:DNA-binding NtrC family response regulator
MRLSGPAIRELLDRPFPGNVRELRNAMAYAAAVTDGEVLEPWHLPAKAAGCAPSGEPAVEVRFRPLAEEIEELERRRMKEALAACHGNQSRAADLISMPRRTFVTKVGRYGLR